MIAMQYRFRLPSDYDMTIIENRVRENGHRLDNFPGLVLKAWCYTSSSDTHTASEPLYAPFYLWQDSASMAAFLQSDGFKKLVTDFGRPAIDCWPVLEYRPGSNLQHSAFARREIVPITSCSDLSHIGSMSVPAAGITRILAWDVRQWQRVCFELSDLPFDDAPGAERYRVGHISLPARS
ncbi:DUF4865 family protein [Erwinia sp. JUb26]|uniref:DUF4865 family protein n=1 Tax=Erwinia sp. JUb26 TaxID=2485126 RepID=UPI000F45FFCC|nr:DUF4865 family protein [Erwinia sp. JUb26]ROR05143.1 uncharacterized protein DUF4865 [Erwinia sp. JUb26]